MDKIKLTRTGKTPLEFSGEQIAEASTKWAAGKEQNRWHEITVYRTKGGKYVAHVEYCTQWQGELGHSEAEPVDSLEAVAYFLQDYIPAAHVQGFPDRDEFRERQANLLNWLQRRWDDAVGEILAKLGATETVE